MLHKCQHGEFLVQQHQSEHESHVEGLISLELNKPSQEQKPLHSQ